VCCFRRPCWKLARTHAEFSAILHNSTRAFPALAVPSAKGKGPAIAHRRFLSVRAPSCAGFALRFKRVVSLFVSQPCHPCPCRAVSGGVTQVHKKGSERARNQHEHCLSVSLGILRFRSVRVRLLNSQRGGQRFDPAQLHQTPFRNCLEVLRRRGDSGFRLRAQTPAKRLKFDPAQLHQTPFRNCLEVLRRRGDSGFRLRAQTPAKRLKFDPAQLHQTPPEIA